MRTRLLGTIAIAALAFTACGGDDDGGDGGSGDGGGERPQDELADLMIASFDEASDIEGVDIEIDEDCIRDKVDQLSDEDAQAILDAGPDAELTESAEAIGTSMLECVEGADLGDTDGEG